MEKAHSKKGSPVGKSGTKVDGKGVVEVSLKVDRRIRTHEVAAPVKMSRGMRKQVRRLETQLADAARDELKRVRKLEKAHYRLQRAEAALEELRAVSELPAPAAAQIDLPVSKTAAAEATTAAKTPARARTATPKATPKPAAPKSRAKPEPAAAEPTQDAAPEA